MNFDGTLLGYFLHASLVVKLVMLLLILASIFSWASILQRYFYFQEINKAALEFEKNFWLNEQSTNLQSEQRLLRKESDGLSLIFWAGMKEYQRLKRQTTFQLEQIIENVNRAMKIAQMREQEKLEVSLPFLAIVGTISPYIGLFGTVWGIMQALSALSHVQQATIAMVAPGIAETLIATALGLFAAIPAIVAYNRFLTDINKIMTKIDTFREEFINNLIRQFHVNSSKASPEKTMEA